MCKPASTFDNAVVVGVEPLDKAPPQSKAESRAELAWSNVKYTLKAGKKKEKVVIDSVSGMLPPSSLLAIMGPSGSGKTSLLNVLAGRVPLNNSSRLEGKMTINGRVRSDMPKICAYVEQDEALFALSTVRETLMFTAQLRMPHGTTLQQQKARVDAVCAELNLSNAMDTKIGNQRVRGVSGGERKRANIGVELLNDPPVIFMDEPTSGLDSFQAQAVMQTLKKLSTEGKTIVASIHQPRSSIYAMLDRCCLLAGGRCCYFGGAGAELAEHFSQLGYSIPPSFNPADYLLDLISTDLRSKEAGADSSARVASIVEAWASSRSDAAGRLELSVRASISGESEVGELRMGTRGCSCGEVMSSLQRGLVAFRLLLKRTWRELTRDVAGLIFKHVMATFFAVLFGLVYLQIDNSQTSLQNRSGLLFFLSMNQAFSTVISTATVIPIQLSVVTRERAARMYGAFSFYLATFVCTLPLEFLPALATSALTYFMVGLRGGHHFFVFLGVLTLAAQCGIGLGMVLSAAIKDVETAPKIAPAVVVLLLMFSGFFLNEDDIPSWLVWLKAISFIRYCFQALCINEFRGAAFDCTYSDGSKAEVCYDGDQFLGYLSFEDDELWKACVCLAGIAVGLNLVALLLLILRSPKFIRMQQTS